MKLKQSLHDVFTNIFQLSHESVFYNLFQDNKLAEYHLKRSIYEELTNHHLLNNNTYADIIITKDQSKGMIICKLKVIKNGERIKDVFNIYLHHQSNSILKIDKFLFSSYCRNCGIEKQIYRYIAIIAKKAGYIYLRPSSIMYESNNKFDFSIPNIGDIFGFFNILNNSNAKDREKFIKENKHDENLKIFSLYYENTSKDFTLHNLIAFEDTSCISDIISKTNCKLSEIEKNYLIKMARKLYCQCNECDEKNFYFRGKCVLLSNIVHFLAIEKLNIPYINNIILDSYMDNKGAHTVAVICGRQVDATADQFVYNGQTLNPYEDNSLYFSYTSSTLCKYKPEEITQYIKLFNNDFKKLSIEDFLYNEDNDLYKKSLEIPIFS